MDVDRRTLIGRALRPATYTVTEVDVNDFLGVVDEPGFAATCNESGLSEVTTSAKGGARLAPPSFAPFVAVLGLLKTFDWQDDFLFNYRTGTAMFGGAVNRILSALASRGVGGHLRGYQRCL